MILLAQYRKRMFYSCEERDLFKRKTCHRARGAARCQPPGLPGGRGTSLHSGPGGPVLPGRATLRA